MQLVSLRPLCLTLLGVVCFLAPDARSEDSILSDINGDGTITYLAFGDSLTYGVGDGRTPGDYVEEVDVPPVAAGYVSRLSTLLGVPTLNGGIPGEELVTQGVDRFPTLLAGSSADIVGIFEGTNDSISRVSSDVYRKNIQRLINVSVALGKVPVLFTLATPCCLHAGREPFTQSYSAEIRELAITNDLQFVDLERAWESTCESRSQCSLFNLPEGLHPNRMGYDGMAQVVAASLLGIDLFTDGGPAALESALGLDSGTVVIKAEVAQ